jgi:hypothetical protein
LAVADLRDYPLSGTVSAAWHCRPFDLRVLGIAKGIPPATIQRLVSRGIGGYFLNVMTGRLFFSRHPDQYFYNNAGRLKALLMAVAGINILVFYSTAAFAV